MHQGFKSLHKSLRKLLIEYLQNLMFCPTHLANFKPPHVTLTLARYPLKLISQRVLPNGSKGKNLLLLSRTDPRPPHQTILSNILNASMLHPLVIKTTFTVHPMQTLASPLAFFSMQLPPVILQTPSLPL